MRSVELGAGREEMAFSSQTADGRDIVIPADAMRLVSQGRLDRRLFDVTTLLKSGYDDAHRDSLPLIVTHTKGGTAPRLATATSPEPAAGHHAHRHDQDPVARRGRSFCNLSWFPEGERPTGFDKQVRQQDLATLRADFVPWPKEPSAFAGFLRREPVLLS